jgi:hypothetical protein
LASAASFTFALKWSEDNVDVQSEPNLIQIVVSRSEIGAARPLSRPAFTQSTPETAYQRVAALLED